MNYGDLILNVLRDEFLDVVFDQMEKVDRLLDLGCGRKPYQRKYSRVCRTSIAIDVPYTKPKKGSIDIMGRGTSLPFKPHTFDVVLSTEVMDDIPEPSEFLREIFRVLKPNGTLILTTPFLVPLYDAPYEYYRFTSYGLEYLLEKEGFTIDNIKPFGGLHGVLLSFIMTSQTKFWYMVAKAMKLQFLNTKINPFILLLVCLPQKVYLMCHKLFQSSVRFQKIHSKLTYATKGYGVVATKISQT